MLRKLLTVALACCALSLTEHNPTASTPQNLLEETPAQSLRGETIDLDDHWSGARLLAHFGESKLAYDMLRDRPANDAIDAQVERFETRLLTEIGLTERADSLLALQSYSGDLRMFYALYLQRSRLNMMSHRYQRALHFLSRIDTMSFPAFEPYKDYLGLEINLATEQFETAYGIGEARLAAGIPLSLSPRFEERLFEAYIGAKRYDKARQFVGMLRARPSISSKMAPLLIREVDLNFLVGDTIRALETAYALTKKPGTKRLVLEIAESVLSRVSPDRLSDEALLEYGNVMVRNGRLAGADRILTVLMDRPLDFGQKERRTLYQAELYYREKRYSKSYGLLRGKFSDASLERRAMLYRARIYRKTGQPVRSADAYTAFATAFPYDSKAPEALLVASDLYLRTADRTQSMETLERIIETYPSHRYGRIATMKMAVYYLERNHYSRGVSILDKSLERSGRKNQELLYYLSDAYGRMGKTAKRDKLLDELESLNALSFYLYPGVSSTFVQPIMASNGAIALYGERGLLNFLKLVFAKREEAYSEVREVLPPLAEVQINLEASAVYLERARRFLEMGFIDWAEDELNALEANKRLPARVWFELGVLYDDFAMHWKSVRAFQRVYYALDREVRDELDGEFKLLMHPVPYPAQIFENCARYKMSPHLMYAMMRQESRFDMNAVSSAGAMGLMQLMPATSEQVASELGFPEEVRENLFTPEINLTFGIWYASHMLDRSNGNPLMMLAAYNAGLGNARRWFGKSGTDAAVAIENVDGIDYRETRGYVKKIVESARVYHAFYFSDNAGIGGGSR